MEQKDYWNSVADSKEFTTPFHADLFTGLVPADARILDVGCGYGRTLEALRRSGFSRLTGVDFSEGMVARGRKLFPDLDLRVKESDALDFPDESFDAVILFAVLTCIAGNDAQRRLMREIGRVLKPSGILYVNDFLLNSDARNLARYSQYQDKYGTYGVFELPEGAVLRHHDEAWIFALLRAFEQIEYERLTFVTMNGHASNGFYYFGRRAGAG